MKKIFIILLTFLFVSTSNLAFALDEDKDIAMAVDALLVRPLSVVSICIGASIFVVSLPFAAISGSVGKTSAVLIFNPIDFTFNRPLGEFDYKADYYRK